MSPASVSTDREPIAKRLPRLGDLVEGRWQVSTAGIDNSRVPGPTAYEWQPAPPDRGALLSAELRPFLPAAGDWRISERYTEDVRTTHYNGTISLDATSGTVHLRVIDS
ncbi:hypothetical protein M8I35_03495 [Micromonospora sp. MSM11]|nr:hypothetical protein [Micromonospora sp. MSM11]MCL7456246.1 hypothetical protein [Micromonospora sp. MSM11]